MSKIVSLPSLLRGLLLTGVAVVTLYVLSIGPAVVICERAPRLNRTFEVVYGPFQEAAFRSPVKPVLLSYILWWVRLTKNLGILETE